MEPRTLPACVALLGDLVDSRHLDRPAVHRAVLRALDAVNRDVPPLDELRVTVGDEVQGVYARLGDALRAAHQLRALLFGVADLRVGIGGGEVRFVDPGKGIQDGDAWYRARAAIERVEELAGLPGRETARTAIDDGRPAAVPGADAMVRLVDLHLMGLRDGARRSLAGLMAGMDNEEVASREGISPSANSQRVIKNGLRPLADALEALFDLP